MNGMDAWRRLIYSIHLGRDSRQMRLDERFDKFEAFKRAEEILPGIERLDALIRDINEAGGQRPDDRKMRMKLLGALLTIFKENMILKVSEAPSYEHFREHVRGRVTEWLYIHGRTEKANARD